MALSQADRISFSLAIVSVPSKIASINLAQASIQSQIVQLQSLDAANSNLMTNPNNWINAYQPEFNYIDGNLRTTVTEQDIQNAAIKVLGNSFFPNNPNVSVPSLAPNNVWTKLDPFALNFAIGKNYSESYSVVPNNEALLTAAIQSYTGLTPPATVMASANAYIATLNAELAVIVSNDPNSTNQTNNNAAKTNITTVILPALNTFLISEHLPSLQTAVTTRASFLTTRKAQLNAILGTISQDISSGAITSSSGYYGQRYSVLALRLNALGGSLTQLSALQTASNAQDGIKASIRSNANAYYQFCPTSSLKADASGLNILNINDTSFLTAGMQVYIVSDTQEEIIRAVKSINGSAVTLNDVVPAKYRISDNARLYVDNT